MNNNLKYQLNKSCKSNLFSEQNGDLVNKSYPLERSSNTHIDCSNDRIPELTKSKDKISIKRFKQPAPVHIKFESKSCKNNIQNIHSAYFKDQNMPIKMYKFTSKHVSDKIELYVPPFKRRLIEQRSILDIPEELERKQRIEIQRQNWDILKTCIFGTINRINTTNIKPLTYELFRNANLIRAKGLLSKAVFRATKASPMHSHVYAALIAVINTKLPEVGEIILARLISQFLKEHKRKDKINLLVITKLIGNLFNYRVCHDLLILQILTLLLDGDPTDDNIDVAVELTKNIAISLKETSSKGLHAILERFRNLLHHGAIGKRVTFKIVDLMKERKNRFESYPSILDDLDLVNVEDQITLELGLTDNVLETKEELDVFCYDPNFDENESQWNLIKKEVLNDSAGEDIENNSELDEQSYCSEKNDNTIDDLEYRPDGFTNLNDNVNITVHDLSEKDMIHLRRTIYLTIMSSATFEECAHKLIKINIPNGKEMELVNMLIECCSQERTFLQYYALIASRFCLLHVRWTRSFEQSFVQQYNTIHRLETNKLRNVAKLFVHLLHTDSLPWSCFSTVKLNENETTSSSRIFLKILVQGIAGAMGITSLLKRFERNNQNYTKWYAGMFPEDDLSKTRYAINFFTSIGLGSLTNSLRDILKKKSTLDLRIRGDGIAKDSSNSLSEDTDGSSVNSTSDSSSCSSSTTISTSTNTNSFNSTSSCSSRTCSKSYTSSDNISNHSDISSLCSYNKKRIKNGIGHMKCEL